MSEADPEWARVTVEITGYVDLAALQWPSLGTTADELRVTLPTDPEAIMWLAEDGIVLATVEPVVLPVD